ncbi:MAG: hypothetical protein MJ102_07830 [Clostridia bacterium]|nr:hypothetical protein [Clostridia bacterium]
MGERRRFVLAVAAAAAAAAILWAAAAAVSGAEKKIEKSEYAGRQLAAKAFSEAADELKKAAESGDKTALGRAAGRAEAYLSQAGIEGSGTAYSVIKRICIAENDNERSALIRWLTDSAHAAEAGDGGKALRVPPDKVNGTEVREHDGALIYSAFRSSEDAGEERAEEKAISFSCENVRLISVDGLTFPPSYCFSSENVFVRVSADGKHILEYCFDRDPLRGREYDQAYGFEIASEIVRGEIADLSEDIRMSDFGEYYRFEWLTDSGEIMVTAEIYGDTGRLRRFDALGYYAALNE